MTNETTDRDHDHEHVAQKQPDAAASTLTGGKHRIRGRGVVELMPVFLRPAPVCAASQGSHMRAVRAHHGCAGVDDRCPGPGHPR
jgi:hypothetical protein